MFALARIGLAALACSLGMPALAADSYTIDTRHTYPVFEINHLGFSTQRGRFNKVTGKIVLDPAARNGSIDLSIDASSIDMGLEAWDAQMRGEDFFNTVQFPVMTFKSTKVLFDGDKIVGAEGEFTLLGITRQIKVAASGFTCGTHPINRKTLCGVDVSTLIKRSEYGMTKYLPGISDEVRISVPVEAFRD